MNEFQNASEAAAAIIEAHQNDITRAAAFIFDFCNDPAITSSPTLINAMKTLHGDEVIEPDNFDVTMIHSNVVIVNEELADELAAVSELCPLHSCDPEICEDESHNF